ncbi:MAG: hypothetical protein JNK30_10010 [Phenylobacterium sp.]|uniref:hypothetical protein n=1 Tax=Phenylobacterium sp. TaxID=1871053 RepID=UPI001A396798|nr:hypothetical protein [Phenylobacterium sp.]MBL8771703.1 hypothetical protein [Phenylobacterium sp.]
MAAALGGWGTIRLRDLVDAAACPLSRTEADGLDLRAALVLPMRRSMVVQRGLSPDGKPELTLFHDGREISFDEPELFGFAEALARQDRFLAGEATGWGDGYAWSRVAPLLTELVSAGVLMRAEAAPAASVVPGVRPSPLPPARSARARWWDEGETLMAELTGRPLETGWLEMVIPVFRIAHAALDADGRQVGEANVFPPALRIETPTRWRTCPYEGSRHQPDRPMNVEALRGMQAHWKQMMAALGRIRAAWLARTPDAQGRALTIGEIERLAVCVLGVPTYALVRARDPVASGSLHPTLSSLFRVTDGLRMVMHQMLFVPLGEPTRDPDETVSAADIHAYAERSYAFHSEHGVCAGPPHMVAEFLRVIVEGEAPDPDAAAPLAPAVEAALADLPAAMDYAMLGLQAHAATFSVWPAAARAYAALADILSDNADAGLAARFRTHLGALRTASYLGDEALRARREAVYEEMLDACGRWLGQARDASRIARARRDARARMAAQGDAVRAVLAARLGPAAADAAAEAVLDACAAAMAAISVGSEAQREINARLGRPAPIRSFDAADLDLHNRLNDLQPRRLPYLFDELADAFGLALTLSADGLRLAAANPHSAATPSGSRANPRASLNSGMAK